MYLFKKSRQQQPKNATTTAKRETGSFGAAGCKADPPATLSTVTWKWWNLKTSDICLDFLDVSRSGRRSSSYCQASCVSARGDAVTEDARVVRVVSAPRFQARNWGWISSWRPTEGVCPSSNSSRLPQAWGSADPPGQPLGLPAAARAPQMIFWEQLEPVVCETRGLGAVDCATDWNLKNFG